MVIIESKFRYQATTNILCIAFLTFFILNYESRTVNVHILYYPLGLA
jgi:hypothetical protein